MRIAFMVGYRKNIKGVVKMKKCEATIGTYLGIIEIDEGLCYQIDSKSNKKVEGYLFGSYIYDFKNSKRYYVLKRDEYGFLESSEYSKIKTNVEYALEVSEKVNSLATAKVKKLTGPIKR